MTGFRAHRSPTSSAVTLPIIAFAQYVDPDPSESVLSERNFMPFSIRKHAKVGTIELAAIRALMIAVGIVGALLMNSLVFPRHCRVCREKLPVFVVLNVKS